ncbi:hypothetical protein QJR26_18465 (plasmid) [Clostridium baratii]
MIHFGEMNWSGFDYKGLVINLLPVFIMIFFGIFLSKLMMSNTKTKIIDIFNIIDCIIQTFIMALLSPMLLIGMNEIAINTNVDVEKIIWIIIVLGLIRIFYIRIIQLIKELLEKCK